MPGILDLEGVRSGQVVAHRGFAGGHGREHPPLEGVRNLERRCKKTVIRLEHLGARLLNGTWKRDSVHQLHDVDFLFEGLHENI